MQTVLIVLRISKCYVNCQIFTNITQLNIHVLDSNQKKIFSSSDLTHFNHWGIVLLIFEYTKILEVNFCAFAYRLFHEDFSPIDGALYDTQPLDNLWIASSQIRLLIVDRCMLIYLYLWFNTTLKKRIMHSKVDPWCETTISDSWI